MDLISAGTTAGLNQGVYSIGTADMDLAEVAAVAPTAAPAGLAAPALALPAGAGPRAARGADRGAGRARGACRGRRFRSSGGIC